MQNDLKSDVLRNQETPLTGCFLYQCHMGFVIEICLCLSNKLLRDLEICCKHVKATE